MLDAEARMLLDLMEKAVQEGRPKLHTLPYAVGRQAVDKMSEDSEADPPQVGESVDGDFAGPGGKITYLDAAEVKASAPVQDYKRAWPLWRAKALNR